MLPGNGERHDSIDAGGHRLPIGIQHELLMIVAAPLLVCGAPVVALAWLLQRREVTAPIIGPRTLPQLEGASLRATEIELDDDVLKQINEIFPGPGKAPEAYAW